MRHLSSLVLASLVFACSDNINVASGGSGGGAPTVGGAGGASTSSFTGGTSAGGSATGGSGGIAPPDHIVECQGHVYACGDLVDNDLDGLVDSLDPDCLGPCDNTEDSLFGGIPGQTGPACKVDCYFDQDSGPGNDNCYWSHECDPNEVAPTFYPEPAEGDQCEYSGPGTVLPPTGKTCAELNAEQSQACHDYCGPLTPNGCDCFGCCELPANSGAFVWLGSEGVDGTTVCTLDKLGDPTICHPCAPVADCLNDCDPCEVCIGKPTPDPGCNPGSGGAGGGSGSQCPQGVQECGQPNQAACPNLFACVTGCCIEVPS